MTVDMLCMIWFYQAFESSLRRDQGALRQLCENWRNFHMDNEIVCYTMPDKLYNFTFNCAQVRLFLNEGKYLGLFGSYLSKNLKYSGTTSEFLVSNICILTVFFLFYPLPPQHLHYLGAEELTTRSMENFPNSEPLRRFGQDFLSSMKKKLGCAPVPNPTTGTSGKQTKSGICTIC
jgi:hypothetical protein